MRESLRRTDPASVSPNLQHQLNLYALAAGATGVGVLVFSGSAEARIVYTAVHKTVRLNHALPIDLNRDGIRDFDVLNLTHNSTSPRGDVLAAEPLNSGNQIIAQRTSRGYGASALLAKFTVGSSAKNFRSGRDLMAFYSTRSVRSGGLWKNVTKRYLGLKFLIKGKIHYGWARLNVQITNQVNATLSGFAYETIPNKPIVTGRIGASLGELAGGRSLPSRMK